LDPFLDFLLFAKFKFFRFASDLDPSVLWASMLMQFPGVSEHVARVIAAEFPGGIMDLLKAVENDAALCRSRISSLSVVNRTWTGSEDTLSRVVGGAIADRIITFMTANDGDILTSTS
jgi:hypothetical protein